MNRRPRVLAISSGGGHWVQLCRVLPALDGCALTLATVDAAYQDDVPEARLMVVSDATRWSRWQLVKAVVSVAWVLVRVRPHVIVSTGAAPGAIAVRLGRLLGARTLWIDSMANVEQLSYSARMVADKVNLLLTQWPQLDGVDGARYRGSAL